MAGFDAGAERLSLELQPARWALRLVPLGAAQSLSVLCVVRAADGRWLAGRRAAWLASWAGRWALGAGGSVEVDENPAFSMERELQEEWSVEPERLTVEALALLPSEVVLLVGQAWLAAGATVTPDDEHDEFAWWPAELEQWPEEADEPLRRMASLLSGQ
jgi:ADP-ribose pyrophosphatase YjhB (NUDIX family)